jgi:hypothetical protein
MTDRGPVNRCSVAGCIVIGHWPEDGTCPVHADPFRQPTEIGYQEVPDAP